MKGDSSSISLQERIAERFRRLIESGALRPGERLPTVRQVGRDMSVSITPARMAFQLLEKEGLIHTRRGAGTFVGHEPSRLPRVLDIGVLFREPRDWSNFDNYGLKMFQGIQSQLQAEGHRTFLVTMKRQGADAPEMAEQFADRAAHGYVLDEYVPDALVERFARTGRPVVVVNRACGVAGVGVVRRDEAMAGRMAGEKVLGAGHRFIAWVDRTHKAAEEAHRAFSQTLAAASPSVPAPAYVPLNTNGPREGVAGPVAELLRQRPRPTALVFADDLLASFFFQWAQSTGWRIPGDVSVVGKLDLALAAHTVPPLTTIRFDPAEIGAQAVREVIRCCRERGRQPASHLIAGQWVERQTLAEWQ